MARKIEPDVPADPAKQEDNAAKLLRESEAADPFDKAAEQRFGRLIAEIITKPTKKPPRP